MRELLQCWERTNNAHVCEDWEDVAPADTAESRPSFIQTSGRAIEKGSDEFEEQGTRNLDHSHGTHGQSLEQEVRNIEIGCLGEVLGKKILGRQRVFNDLGGCSGRC